MLTREFLEEYGLYRRFGIPQEQYMRFEWQNYRGPPLSRHCKSCHHQTTWNQRDSFKHIAGDNPQFSNLHGSLQEYANQIRENRAPQKGPRADNIESLIYRCDACKHEEINYVVQFVMELESAETWPPIIKFHARKIGQWPSPLAELPSELREWLGEYEPVFTKGRLCEQVGLGIGALVYYRRVVEDVIQKLLDDMNELFEVDSERDKYAEKLKEVHRTKSHAQKIELVRDLIPPSLKRNSGNPMGLLHSSLSDGIHNLPEEDCLEIAAFIRTFLVDVVRGVRNLSCLAIFGQSSCLI